MSDESHTTSTTSQHSGSGSLTAGEIFEAASAYISESLKDCFEKAGEELGTEASDENADLVTREAIRLFRDKLDTDLEMIEEFPSFVNERAIRGRPIEPTIPAMTDAIAADIKTAEDECLTASDVSAWRSRGGETKDLDSICEPKSKSGVKGRDWANGFKSTVGVSKFGKLFTLNKVGKTEIDRYRETGLHPELGEILLMLSSWGSRSQKIEWGGTTMPDLSRYHLEEHQQVQNGEESSEGHTADDSASSRSEAEVSA